MTAAEPPPEREEIIGDYRRVADVWLHGPGFGIPCDRISDAELAECGGIAEHVEFDPEGNITGRYLDSAPPRVVIKPHVWAGLLRSEYVRVRFGDPDNVMRLDGDNASAVYVLRRFDVARRLILATWPD